MKLGLYLRYSTRSLIREGQRTVLALFCVAVGVMAIVSLQLVGNMINLGLTSNVAAGNGGDISVRSDVSPLAAGQISAAVDPLVAKGEITQYTAISGHQAEAVGGNDIAEPLTLRAVDPSVFPIAGSPLFSEPGDGTLSSLLTGQNVVVNVGLANELHAKLGDTYTVTSDDGRTLQASIAGIIQNTGLFRTPQMLVALDVYSSLHSSSGLTTFTAVYINVPDHSDANAARAKADIAKAFQGSFGAVSVTTTKDALQQQANQVQNIRYFLQIVGLLALLIGGVGIMNTMQVLLRRRQTEIAMLKTAGYRNGDLFALFGLEAALLGVLGGALGAAAGIGVSFFIKGIAEKAFFITLPTDVDPLIVASGVAIGFFTALIFGLMPIVQASQVRPLAVLRELPEGSRVGSRLLTLLLTLLLAALFFALSLSILQNVRVALGAVVGTSLFLLLQGIFFGAIVFVVTRIPVPERLLSWSTPPLLLLAALFVAGGIELPSFAPLFGTLAVLLVLLVALPREWKANIKLALRNIGRQRVRTITTLVAILIGVFGIGVIFVLGQNIQQQVNDALTAENKPTAFILAPTESKDAVDQQIAQLPTTGPTSVSLLVLGSAPTALNGAPLDPTKLPRDERGFLSAVQGFDLANGNAPDFQIVAGAQDGGALGRTLGAADAGTGHVILDVDASRGSLHFKLGDVLSMVGIDKKSPVDLTIVGFYDSTDANAKTTAVASLLTDSATAPRLAGQQRYVYALHLDPNHADAELHQVQLAVPGILTFSVGDLLLFVTNLLNNLLVLLTSVMSLAVVAGLIIIANAVALAMLERRRELGILKATGFTSRSVLAQVLLEFALVGFSGSLLAMLLVSVALTLLGNLLLNTALTAAALTVLGIVLATALICMLIAGLVAWSATRVRPLEVLRYE
jgi:predicted lysophospholipase L1 biosynthesis ABC-type transport system permease subunit